MCKDECAIAENETVEAFNDHFVTVGANFSNKINEDNSRYLSEFMQDRGVNMHSTWECINYEETLLLIEGIDVGKNSNIANLQTKFLKECLLCVPEKLMRLLV